MTKFEQIPIDKMSIPQGELNIDSKTRSNLFAWTGQFSPQFVETLLNYYAVKDDIILDPFAGSGTTLGEAARKGISAYGIELNPSAYYMAKIYELANKPILKREKLIQETEEILASILQTEQILPTLIERIEHDHSSELSTLLCALVVLLDLFNNPLSLTLLFTKWEALKNTVLKLPYTDAEIHMDMGDSRHFSHQVKKATLLITSPPYINVLNYHQKYRRSVETLGFDVLAIAKKEIGSNRKNRSNRLLTVIQYCIDMALSIKEAIYSCSPKARMIYVVGRESKDRKSVV